MSQEMAPMAPGEGNTKTSPLRMSASKRWCFTAYNTNVKKMIEMIGSDGFYVFGEEICPTTGKQHLQGYIEFNEKKRPLECIKSKDIHWEKSKGTPKDNIKYCTKDGKYHTNDKKRVPKPLRILDEKQLYDWQKDIVEIIKEEPDDRTIHWYWESKGCAGKTSFCKYLSAKYEAIPLEGKKNDILYCAAMFESEVYIWDMERAMEEYVSYGAIEKIKNGYFMCSKYESKPVIRNNPHVFIFANFAPDIKALSIDRWKIIKINQENDSELDND